MYAVSHRERYSSSVSYTVYLSFFIGPELGFDERLPGEGTYASLLRQPQPNHLPIEQLQVFGHNRTLRRTICRAERARRWKLDVRTDQKLGTKIRGDFSRRVDQDLHSPFFRRKAAAMFSPRFTLDQCSDLAHFLFWYSPCPPHQNSDALCDGSALLLLPRYITARPRIAHVPVRRPDWISDDSPRQAAYDSLGRFPLVRCPRHT